MHRIPWISLYLTFLTTTYAKAQMAVDPSSLPTLPNQAQYNIRWSNKHDKGNELTMFFDQPSNRGAIKTKRNGTLLHTIFDFNLKQQLTISGLSCHAATITADLNKSAEFPFPFTIKGDTFSMMEANVAWRYYGEKYLIHETTRFNGIPCCQIRTIHSIPEDDKTLTYYDFYFAAPSWVDGSSSGDICSKKLIGIVSTVHFGSQESSAEERLEVLELTEHVPETEAFQTPPGMFCEGRKEGMKFPSFGGYLKFSKEEIIESPESAKALTQVWYDEYSKISRHDSVSRKVTSGSSEATYSTAIYDHTSGYIYQINSESGSCTAMLIDSSGDIDATSHVWGPTSNHLRQIQYVGKRRCRHMECDVWTGIDVIDRSHNRVVEFYLNQDQMLSAQGKMSATITAVRMQEFRITGSQGWNTMHVEYYDFQTTQDDWSVYDVSSCFGRTDKSTLVFSLQGNYSQIIDGNAQDFKQAFRLSLLGRLQNVSPLRLNNLKIDAKNENSFFVTIVLMESIARLKGTETKELTNENVIGKLLENADNGRLSVLLQSAPAVKVEEYLVTGFTHYIEEPIQDKFRTDKKDFSSGDMAGMAMGMLAVGILSGIGFFILFLRIRKNMTIVKWLRLDN